MEFRVGERWEMLDDGIPGTDGEFFAKDLSQVRLLLFFASSRVLQEPSEVLRNPTQVDGVSPGTGHLPPLPNSPDSLVKPGALGSQSLRPANSGPVQWWWELEVGLEALCSGEHCVSSEPALTRLGQRRSGRIAFGVCPEQ